MQIQSQVSVWFFVTILISSFPSKTTEVRCASKNRQTINSGQYFVLSYVWALEMGSGSRKYVSEGSCKSQMMLLSDFLVHWITREVFENASSCLYLLQMRPVKKEVSFSPQEEIQCKGSQFFSSLSEILRLFYLLQPWNYIVTWCY